MLSFGYRFWVHISRFMEVCISITMMELALMVGLCILPHLVSWSCSAEPILPSLTTQECEYIQLYNPFIVASLREGWLTFVNTLCVAFSYTHDTVLGQQWWWMSTKSLQCTPAWSTTHSVCCCMKMTPKDLMSGRMWVTHENKHKP